MRFLTLAALALALSSSPASANLDMNAICRQQTGDGNAVALVVDETAGGWRCQVGVDVQRGCSQGSVARNDSGRWDGWYCAPGGGAAMPAPAPAPVSRSVSCRCYKNSIIAGEVFFDVDTRTSEARVRNRADAECVRKYSHMLSNDRWHADHCRNI
jgi:hypothetical protein